MNGKWKQRPMSKQRESPKVGMKSENAQPPTFIHSLGELSGNADIELLCLGGDDLHRSNDGKSSHIICQSTNKTNHHPLNCSNMSKLLQLLTLSQSLSIASARRLNESQPDNS